MVLPDQLDTHDLNELLVRLGILVTPDLKEILEQLDIQDIQATLAQAQQYNDQLDTLAILVIQVQPQQLQVQQAILVIHDPQGVVALSGRQSQVLQHEPLTLLSQ
jgi:hypothetical protein